MTERSESEVEKLHREINEQTAARIAMHRPLTNDDAQQIVNRSMRDVPKDISAVQQLIRSVRSFLNRGAL